MQFVLAPPDCALEPDAAGQPAPPPGAPERRPDLVIAPLLAFDRFGGRLGQGGGHYDQALANLRRTGPVFVLGLAFAGQEVDRLDLEAHDQPLDAVLTARTRRRDSALPSGPPGTCSTPALTASPWATMPGTRRRP